MDLRLDSPPFSVLQHFAPHTHALTWQRAPTGFSGAQVWRGDDSGTPRVALKAWPMCTTRERVQQIHTWLAQAAHLPFVPSVFANRNGESVCVEAGRMWDCCRWQPGTTRATPTAAEVEAACAAVAELHRAWSKVSERGPCPGVRNRLRILVENETLLRAGSNALPPVSPRLDPLLRRAVSVVAGLAPNAVSKLEPWAERMFVLQPCVRDLRGEHVLFEAERVTGIIDFGAMAIDSHAVDLARLLVDYAGADDTLFEAGLSAYRRCVDAFDVSDELVFLLARSGAICSVLGWLVRLIVRREPVYEEVSITSRLTRLTTHIEQITWF